MDDKNLSNTPTIPATPEAPAAGGINFDQLLITNQEPEHASVTLSDHLAAETSSPSLETPATDQTSSLLSQANAEMKEHQE
jgi:hypothetical protein